MEQPAAPNINILAFKDQQTSSLNKFLDWGLQYGRIIVIVTEFIVIAAFISRFYFDRKLADLHDHISSQQQFIEQSQATQQNFLAFQQGIVSAGTLMDQRHDLSIVLQNINAAKPGDLEIRELIINGTSLSITAQVPSPNTLNVFLQNLNGSGKFTNLSIDDIAIKDGQLLMTASAQLTNKAYQ